jgi:hypothetical protein
MDRRVFLSRLLGGSALFAVAGAAGCVGPAGVSGALGGEGPVEVVPRRDGQFYFNTVPTFVPSIRNSPAITPDWSISKAFE